MKKVILRKLILQNWRSQNVEVQFNDDLTKVFGQNKAGKSSLRHSFLWLLTGYDGENRMNHNLFDNNHNYTPEDSPIASVEAIVKANGYEYSLKRTAEVGWVRKRGNKEYERKGTDDYKFFIDGVEMSAGRYKEKIAELFCDMDSLRSIIDINYFLGLDWKEQRKALSVMAGEITNEDFKGNYKELFAQLVKYSIPELKARITSEIKPMKDSLKSLPLTIKALEENLPDVKEAEEAKELIKGYKEQISDIDEQLQGQAISIKPIIEKRNKEWEAINELKRNYNLAESEYNSAFEAECNAIKTKIREYESTNREILNSAAKRNSERASIINRIDNYEKDVERYTKIREVLLAKKDKTNKLVFTNDICPYCGQMLPEHELEQKKKEFYEAKETEINSIIAEGRSNNDKKSAALAEIERLKEELKEKPELSAVTADISIFEEELKEKKKSFIPFKDTEKGQSLLKEIEEAEASVTQIPEQDNDGLLAMKKTLMEQIEECSRKLGLVEERAKQEAKIEDLKKQLKETSSALAEQEKLDSQIKEYEEEKANIISKRVGKYFKRCKIKMMSQDKSGTWIPDCVISGADGAVASTANGAERILIGIDIANAFAEYFEVSFPLFVDDVNLIDSNNEIKTYHQLIELIVNDNDSYLRIE